VPLLTLDNAKAQLKITSHAQDLELAVYVAATIEVIERYVGPVDPRTVTETQDISMSGASVLVLRTTPVVSVTSIVPILGGGTPYDVAGLDLDGETGIVRRINRGRFYGPLRNEYIAGRATVPASMDLAGRMLLQHLWTTKQGPGRPARGGADDVAVETTRGFGYAVPNRVLQLLEEYRLPPGVA
jgi:hypothetical protein